MPKNFLLGATFPNFIENEDYYIYKFTLIERVSKIQQLFLIGQKFIFISGDQITIIDGSSTDKTISLKINCISDFKKLKDIIEGVPTSYRYYNSSEFGSFANIPIDSDGAETLINHYLDHSYHENENNLEPSLFRPFDLI